MTSPGKGDQQKRWLPLFQFANSIVFTVTGEGGRWSFLRWRHFCGDVIFEWPLITSTIFSFSIALKGSWWFVFMGWTLGQFKPGIPAWSALLDMHDIFQTSWILTKISRETFALYNLVRCMKKLRSYNQLLYMHPLWFVICFFLLPKTENELVCPSTSHRCQTKIVHRSFCYSNKPYCQSIAIWLQVYEWIFKPQHTRVDHQEKLLIAVTEAANQNHRDHRTQLLRIHGFKPNNHLGSFRKRYSEDLLSNDEADSFDNRRKHLKHYSRKRVSSESSSPISSRKGDVRTNGVWVKVPDQDYEIRIKNS